MADHNQLSNFIWQIADLLRSPYRPPQYERKWEVLPQDLFPGSTVSWQYKQWRAEGAIEKLLCALQGQSLFS